jgi:hypothetical protein
MKFVILKKSSTPGINTQQFHQSQLFTLHFFAGVSDAKWPTSVWSLCVIRP